MSVTLELHALTLLELEKQNLFLLLNEKFNVLEGVEKVLNMVDCQEIIQNNK